MFPMNRARGAETRSSAPRFADVFRVRSLLSGIDGGPKHGVDSDDEETTLWRRVMETLLARGASRKEAIDGAASSFRTFGAVSGEAQQREPPPRKEARGS